MKTSIFLSMLGLLIVSSASVYADCPDGNRYSILYHKCIPSKPEKIILTTRAVALKRTVCPEGTRYAYQDNQKKCVPLNDATVKKDVKAVLKYKKNNS